MVMPMPPRLGRGLSDRLMVVLREFERVGVEFSPFRYFEVIK